MKEVSLIQETSIWKKSQALSAKLVLMKKGFAIKKLRIHKEKNSFKSRRTQKATERLDKFLASFATSQKKLSFRRVTSFGKLREFLHKVSPIISSLTCLDSSNSRE